MAVERYSLKTTVIEEIKKYIMKKRLSSGDKLPTEREFMEMFEVSRSVVREALSYMENTGIISVKQGQGAFINDSNIAHLVENFFFLWQINEGDIRDIQNLRILFESAAIDDIVRRRQPKNLQALSDQIRETRAARTEDAFRQADQAFHQKILEETGNQLFEAMTKVITTYFYEADTIAITDADIKQGVSEHEKIVEAMENGDAKRAKELLRTHMEHTKI